MDIFKQRLSEYKKLNGEPLSLKSQELYFNNIRMIVEKHGLDWKIESLKKYLSVRNPMDMEHGNNCIGIGYVDDISPTECGKDAYPSSIINLPMLNFSGNWTGPSSPGSRGGDDGGSSNGINNTIKPVTLFEDQPRDLKNLQNEETLSVVSLSGSSIGDFVKPWISCNSCLCGGMNLGGFTSSFYHNFDY